MQMGKIKGKSPIAVCLCLFFPPLILLFASRLADIMGDHQTQH